MNGGPAAEAQFVHDALHHGYFVCIPVFRAPSYDAVVGKGSRVVRVQVKSCARRTSPKANHTPTYKIELRRAPTFSGGVRGTKQRYAAGAFDILAVWLEEDRSWLFIPKRRLGRKTGLSLKPSHGLAKRLNNWDTLGLR